MRRSTCSSTAVFSASENSADLELVASSGMPHPAKINVSIQRLKTYSTITCGHSLHVKSVSLSARTFISRRGSPYKRGGFGSCSAVPVCRLGSQATTASRDLTSEVSVEKNNREDRARDARSRVSPQLSYASS